LEALLASILLVTAAEIGDKTQLLSFLMAARFPGHASALIAGIAVATLANHALAAAFGSAVGAWLPAQALRWILAACFFAFAFWALIPDKADVKLGATTRRNAFAAATFLFFIAEMGDKTQLATVALAAKYRALVPVIAGTTAGMLIANIPAVLLGERLLRRVPTHIFRRFAAILFAAFGIAVLIFPR
jgi:Ca2+/H+ antiporter, TMEM165/GDT1 family